MKHDTVLILDYWELSILQEYINKEYNKNLLLLFLSTNFSVDHVAQNNYKKVCWLAFISDLVHMC